QFLLSSQKPLRFGTTTIRRHHLRKNNEHWTFKEITELVKGVSKHGVGSWTKLKRDFFSTSIRTAVHLKDKWRNLLKACGIKFTSKRKVKVQKTMILSLDMELVEEIKHLASKHPYPRRKNY
ncbi:Os10g0443800, partial [Oryza sativa Japonica Group]